MVLDQPIKIKDSLVFSGVHVTGDRDIERLLLTPDIAISCPAVGAHNAEPGLQEET